jgi:Uma2 family endonuclease
MLPSTAVPPGAAPASPPPIHYPESDGEPMADNTRQFRWIVVLFANLAAQYARRDDVFVGGNLFWYPVEGRPEIRIAPDVLVVFGRPKGDRGSYKQWEEDNVPLTVVFEVLSPSNTFAEMADKLAFYEEHGVKEYYIFDPDNNRLFVYQRQGEVLRRVRPVEGFVSPRLGIRFDLSGDEMVVFGPAGRFLTFEELQANHEQLQAAHEQLQTSHQQLQTSHQQLQTSHQQAIQRAAHLAELGRKARLGQATAEELQELERLEQQSIPPPQGNAG